MKCCSANSEIQRQDFHTFSSACFMTRVHQVLWERMTDSFMLWQFHKVVDSSPIMRCEDNETENNYLDYSFRLHSDMERSDMFVEASRC